MYITKLAQSWYENYVWADSTIDIKIISAFLLANDLSFFRETIKKNLLNINKVYKPNNAKNMFN